MSLSLRRCQPLVTRTELNKLKMAEENEQKVLEAIQKLDVRLINNNIVDLNSLMQDNQDILDDNA